jgi:hypothetical protein
VCVCVWVGVCVGVCGCVWVCVGVVSQAQKSWPEDQLGLWGAWFHY